MYTEEAKDSLEMGLIGCVRVRVIFLNTQSGMNVIDRFMKKMNGGPPNLTTFLLEISRLPYQSCKKVLHYYLIFFIKCDLFT